MEEDSSQPQRIGGHEVTGQLAEGPRGPVLLARESDDAPPVVIKTLTADPGFVDRLKSLADVSGSHLARTLDAGVDDGTAYVIREYVEGRSLADAVAADGPLTGDALERVAVDTLTALTAVHLAGFAHGGLTPCNVILTGEGLRVTDIGLGHPVGEIGFRAPERLNGQPYGPHADVFAWAATVVFAATGAAPFRHEKQSVLNEEPDVAAVPEPLRQVVLDGLAKDAARRPTTYMALLKLLGHSGDSLPAMQEAPVEQPTVVEGVPPQAGGPSGPGAQVPPGILPIQLPIAGAQMPQMPPPQPAMGAPAAPTPPSPQPGPMGPGPMGPVPVGPGAMGAASEAEMWGPPPGPDQQPSWGPPPGPGPQQNASWGPPPGPGPQQNASWGPQPGQGPQQAQPGQGPPQGPNMGHPPHVVPGQDGARQHKPFPIGLVAGMTAVVLLAGLGLWGANQYSDTVNFSPIAAATTQAAPQQQGDASSALGSDNTGAGVPTQAQGEVTAPWATSPGQQNNEVGPMTLPTDDPATTAGEFTTVPTPPTPAPVPTQPVPVVPTAQPTVTVSQKARATPTKKPERTKKPEPTVTVTKTSEPTKTPQPTPTKTTQEPEPTPTKTTAKPKPTPTPTKTTEKPKPTPTKTSAPPVKNPYSATQVCGGGFSVQRSSSFEGGTTYQLWNNSTSQNCVVTIKSGANVGKKTPVSATLEVQGGSSKTDSGNFDYYAGPVKLTAKGKCVRYSGSAGSGNTSEGWANCG